MSLSAREAAQHMRVTEDTRDGVAPKLFRHPRIGIRILAAGKQTRLAGQTGAAGDGEGHHDAIALLQVFDRPASFDHLTHEFVTQDVAAFHGGNKSAVKVEIGAADGGGRNLHDYILLV